MPEVPNDALASWKARAIVNQDGHVDIPPDRAGGEPSEYSEQLYSLLERDYPMSQLREDLAQLLRSGTMQTRTSRDFALLDGERLQVWANTNASAGYCYIVAWLVPPVAREPVA